MQQLASLTLEFRELKSTLARMRATTLKSSEIIPSFQGALRSLEAKVDVLASQAPTDMSWEAVSEKVTSEVERASAEWVTGRVASEVERVMQTRSNASPAPSSDHIQSVQEELSRLDAKTAFSSKSLSREVLDLKNWINDALADTQRSAAIDKESADHGLKETRKDMRHLQKGPFMCRCLSEGQVSESPKTRVYRRARTLEQLLLLRSLAALLPALEYHQV